MNFLPPQAISIPRTWNEGDRSGGACRQLYGQWIHACEERAALRAERLDPMPFSWGWEWLQDWASRGDASHAYERSRELTRRILQYSDSFFGHERPDGFSLTGDILRFRSPLQSPWPENNTVWARWRPARRPNGRAVLVLPHWNARLDSYDLFCRLLNLLGLSVLVLALPCHHKRKPKNARGAEYVFSANIGRTIACVRQAVIDARCCVDWLEQQGYSRIAMVGTSLGSGCGFLASAHEPRLRVNVFNQISSTFSDVAWSFPTLRRQLAPHLCRQGLREAWGAIDGMSYFDRFSRLPKKSLLICGSYDRVFPRQCVEEVIRAFRAYAMPHRVIELPCGHYTMGWLPFSVVDAMQIASFLLQEL